MFCIQNIYTRQLDYFYILHQKLFIHIVCTLFLFLQYIFDEHINESRFFIPNVEKERCMKRPSLFNHGKKGEKEREREREREKEGRCDMTAKIHFTL